MRFQKFILNQVVKHPGHIDGMQRGHFPNANVGNNPFRRRCRQGKAFVLPQRIETGAEHPPEMHHHIRRQQIHHSQLQQRLVIGLHPFVKRGRPPMLTGPAAINLRNPRSRLLSHPHQSEHFVQRPVPAVVFPALNRNLGRDAHQPGIAKTEHVGPLHHQHGGAVGVVGVNQDVGQGFTEGNMHRRFVNPFAFFQCERHLKIRGQLQINAPVKVIEVS